MKLLVVEDDSRMRDLFRDYLEPDHVIVATGDSTEALALALHHKPDAILLDLTLPGLSGFQLCQTFASMSFTSLTPVLVITGKPAAEYKEFCLKLGASEFLEKPVDFARLKSILAGLRDKRPLERRKEPRVHMHVTLKLKGTEGNGAPFELQTVTDDVSANGFLASSSIPLTVGSEVDVLLCGGHERLTGKAQVVRVEWPEMPWRRYGFRFVEPPRAWILD